MFFKTQHKNYGLTALRAKGRMKKGELNRTETSYAQYLEGEKQSGRVADYWFESLKLKVADGTCWYTPDFMMKVVYPRAKKNGGGWDVDEF